MLKQGWSQVAFESGLGQVQDASEVVVASSRYLSYPRPVVQEQQATNHVLLIPASMRWHQLLYLCAARRSSLVSPSVTFVSFKARWIEDSNRINADEEQHC